MAGRADWVRHALDLVLDSGRQGATARAATINPRAENSTTAAIPNDPESIAYVLDLIKKLLQGRVITACYNIAIVVLLLGFTAAHWRQTRLDRQKWRQRVQQTKVASSTTSGSTTRPSSPVNDGNDENISSGSSTIEGTATPPVLPKPDYDNVDIERLPLLRSRANGSSGNKLRNSGLRTILNRLRGWLAYQPGPIPVINRALPANGVSLFVLCWLGINVFFHFYRCPVSGPYFFVTADRAGFIFIVNLPLLYLLSAKNQPLRLLTGRSYEALNIFHRRVGELMCFEALFHVVGMLLFQFVLAPEWLNPVTAWQYFTHPLIYWGLGAFIPYQLLYFTSLGTVRQKCYELFLASHILLQLAGLVFLYLHFPTAKPYVLIAGGIFILDRLVWRLRLRSTTVDADVVVLEDGQTMMLSADWTITSTSSVRFLGSCLPKCITAGWLPTDHVFLTIPSLGRSHTLQAHPFTIASAAPGHQPGQHAWLNLLIRTHAGFTRDLLRHVQERQESSSLVPHPSTPVRLSARLDGPYGSSHALDMLRACDTAVLVAGGSGIAVVYPLAAALLSDSPRKQRVRLLWVTRSRSHADWIPAERLAELVDAGLELVIPQPTEEAGRPDTVGIVRTWIDNDEGEDGMAGVVVSGPDSMNREVRNACADAIGRGANVRVAVEKFGW
ncbi:uncharacterized protein PgNI_07858 [Pyricularia grisea]|uniref:FAD-binding FR-type domain-containing protein n=1 Tax=Pyricularia grisea TaxID=148305 RepID=A0A6P8B2U3_PYRGI|nr:uncharacterized protein PgNI_07858 [Pyricularia grisea]TLD09023.1 hypothetical protein PgNI_07858 [Pyricularia grisea]